MQHINLFLIEKEKKYGNITYLLIAPFLVFLKLTSLWFYFAYIHNKFLGFVCGLYHDYYIQSLLSTEEINVRFSFSRSKDE